MAHARIMAVGEGKTRVFSESAAVLVFGCRSECERFQKRWVSLRPSYFERNWSTSAVRFDGGVSMNPLYPTYKKRIDE